MIIGYTSGVFDLFHVGHVNFLKNAKSMCDTLIIGVKEDDLIIDKGNIPVIPFLERSEIVRSIKFVDSVVPQDNLDDIKMCKKLKANIIFVGDNWRDSKEWKSYERLLNKIGVQVVHFPYTKGSSSTILNDTIKTLRKNS